MGNKRVPRSFFTVKGGVFGRFNLFDILVFLLLFLCVAVIYVKIAQPKITGRLLYKEAATREVSITVVLDEGMDWIFDDLVVGDFQKGRLGKPIYEITGKEFRPAAEGGRRVFVTLKVKAAVEPQGVLSVRGSALKIGQYFFFDGEKVMFTGRVTKIKVP
jgi:hypothetical protein